MQKSALIESHWNSDFVRPLKINDSLFLARDIRHWIFFSNHHRHQERIIILFVINHNQKYNERNNNKSLICSTFLYCSTECFQMCPPVDLLIYYYESNFWCYPTHRISLSLSPSVRLLQKSPASYKADVTVMIIILRLHAVTSMMMIIIRIRCSHLDDDDHDLRTMQSSIWRSSSSAYDAVKMMIIIIRVQCSNQSSS